MIYFGSDWHLHHAKIIDIYRKDKFQTIDDMQNDFFEAAKIITKFDTLYVLGDCGKDDDHFWNKFFSLPGQKFLISGNHDKGRRFNKDHRWGFVKDYYERDHEDTRLILMHFPIECWNRRAHGSIHLHGHVHGNPIAKIKNRLDLSYDAIGKWFISMDEVLERVKNV